jgi:O-antigen/teichoic acid export membrane protein
MLRKYIPKSILVRNVFTLVSGTAFAQVINFIFSVILTRIYTPGAFGSLSVFLAILAFFLVFSCGKYDVAIVATHSRNDAVELLRMSLIITFFTALISLIMIIAVYIVPLNFYNNTPVRTWLFLIPLSLILLSIFQALWMWNVREKRFKDIFVIRPVEAFITGGLSVSLLSLKGLGLLLGTLIGQISSTILLIIITIRKDSLKIFYFSWKEVKHVALKYSHFPKFNIMQGFVEMLQASAIVLIASNYFPAALIGLYALCMRVLQVPVRLVILPFSHVFFAEASDIYRNGKSLYQLVRRTLIHTSLLSLPLPIFLMFAGPFVFGLVFGAQWKEAGEYARILSPWIFFDILRAPIVQISSIVGKQKQILFLSLLSGLVLITSVILGLYLALSFNKILWIVSISQSLTNILIIIAILKMSKISNSNFQPK